MQTGLLIKMKQKIPISAIQSEEFLLKLHNNPAKVGELETKGNISKKKVQQKETSENPCQIKMLRFVAGLFS